jgi:hypothetical protein
MIVLYLYIYAFQNSATYPDASTYICFSSSVPTMSPYLMNQSSFSGFHLPAADLTFLRSSVSYPSIRRATIVSAKSFSGGGSQSVRSIISYTVFRRCRVTASYLKQHIEGRHHIFLKAFWHRVVLA